LAHDRQARAVDDEMHTFAWWDSSSVRCCPRRESVV
jgi:hypothetical protein